MTAAWDTLCGSWSLAFSAGKVPSSVKEAGKWDQRQRLSPSTSLERKSKRRQMQESKHQPSSSRSIHLRVRRSSGEQKRDSCFFLLASSLAPDRWSSVQDALPLAPSLTRDSTAELQCS